MDFTKLKQNQEDFAKSGKTEHYNKKKAIKEIILTFDQRIP